MAGFIQDRLGPTEVGPKGLLQSVADGLKLLQKEDIVPAAADRWVFLAAPILIFVAVFAGFSVVPLAPNFSGSAIESGVFYLMAIISLDVLGFILAGWSSNNKYALFGAMRAVAQMISYEVPLSLIVLAVVMITQSLSLHEIVEQQGLFTNVSNQLFGITSIEVGSVDPAAAQPVVQGGFLTWNVLRYPLLIPGMLIFFIASLAEANRGPFDIPEAESEIIAGIHTEYSGFRMSIILLSEYAMMWLIALLGVTLFFGGWNTALPNVGSVNLANWTSGSSGEWTMYAWSFFWLFGKAAIWIFLQFWARWTYPRLRVDQLMYLCWKVLTPAALIIVLGAGFWRLWMVS